MPSYLIVTTVLGHWYHHSPILEMMKQRLKDNLVPLRSHSSDTAALRLAPASRLNSCSWPLSCSVLCCYSTGHSQAHRALHGGKSVSETVCFLEDALLSGKLLSFTIAFFLLPGNTVQPKLLLGVPCQIFAASRFL